MSVDDISEFFVHTAQVEPFTFTNALGVDQFGPAVTVAGFADLGIKQTRSPDGTLVMSDGTFYTDPAYAAAFPVNARVTINGKVSRVMTAVLNDSGALDLPDHLAVTLV